MTQCKWCAEEFTPVVKDQMFCKPQHRKDYHAATDVYRSDAIRFNRMDEPGKLKSWMENREATP